MEGAARVSHGADELRDDVRGGSLELGGRRPQLDFIALALHGKKMGFEKVIKMTDP